MNEFRTLSKICVGLLELAKVKADGMAIDKQNNTYYLQYLDHLTMLDNLLVNSFFLDKCDLVYIIERIEFEGAYYYHAVWNGISLIRYPIRVIDDLTAAGPGSLMHYKTLVQECKDFADALRLAEQIKKSMKQERLGN